MIRFVLVSLAALFTFLSGVPPMPGGGPPPRWVRTAAARPASPVNSITITNRSGVARGSYPLQFGRPFLDGMIARQPQVLIDGRPVATQADVKNRYPDGSVEFAVVAVVIPTIPASGSLRLTFRNQPAGDNTPLSRAQMLDSAYDFDARMTLTPASGPAQTADARQMLANGDYRLWTAGPVAQTIMLGDDSTARKYDLGLGDGHRPFRPRFYATFWPATHQVAIRAVGENGNTQELEDLAYRLSISAGADRPAPVYTADLTGTQAKYRKLHWALTTWSERFWLGGTPPAQVDIDDNLAYLEATRFIPNYDTSITVPETAIASEYARWNAHPHDIYDGIWDGGRIPGHTDGRCGGASGDRAGSDLGRALALYRRLADAADVAQPDR